MNRKSRILKMLTKTGLVVLAIVFCYPVLFLLTGSFMGQSELSENLGSVMGEATRYARWNFLPQNPTLKHYIEVLLDSPEYFVMFWNSIKVVMEHWWDNVLLQFRQHGDLRYTNSSLKKVYFSSIS